MNERAILILLTAVFQVSIQSTNPSDDFYQAAVVEFASNRKQEDNIRDYEWFIKQLKEAEVDIIVFPENALHGYDGDVERKLSEIPDPEDIIIPCRGYGFEEPDILQRLSCAAQENTIYVVVNLLERVPCNGSNPDCPSEGRFAYNTDVVFDRTGAVIARYRKFNLHDEYFVSKTDKPDLEMFDTDFGVRFGVFTSFDILFKSPAVDLVEKYNVTNFIHPSYWFGELPFLTALQVQGGWSYAMNVNLLAAGASKPSTGTGGSGIYVGNRGPPIFSMQDQESSTALISRVPKNVRTIRGYHSDVYRTSTITASIKSNEIVLRNEMKLQRDPTLPNFESVILREDETEFKGEVCSGTSLCCKFNVSYRKNERTKQKSYVYRAAAYQGNKSFTRDVSGAVETCAIILCLGPNVEDCGKRPEPSSEYIFSFSKITIEADFRNNETLQMPSILLGNGLPDRRTKMILLGSGHFDFRTKEVGSKRSVKMVLKNDVKSIITFGIYSRDFTKSGGIALHHSVSMCVLVGFFVFFRVF